MQQTGGREGSIRFGGVRPGAEMGGLTTNGVVSEWDIFGCVE